MPLFTGTSLIPATFKVFIIDYFINRYPHIFSCHPRQEGEKEILHRICREEGRVFQKHEKVMWYLNQYPAPSPVALSALSAPRWVIFTSISRPLETMS
jgi:hypothetical protein